MNAVRRTKLFAGAATFGLLALVMPQGLAAGPGHDHGAEAAPQAAVGPSLPRFEAANGRLELVGRVEGQNLRLWLDDWATNQPITKATLNVTIGRRQANATANPDGTFQLALPEATKAGDLPVLVSITGLGEPTLLSAKLTISPAASEAAAHHDHDGVPLSWLLAGGAILVLGAGGGLFLLRRRRAAASIAAGIAAGLGVLSYSVHPDRALAGPGHDHGTEAAPATTAGSPDQAYRLANGGIAAPKPMQRLISLGTSVLKASNLSPALTLNGVVIADPNGSGVVQSQVGGRVSGNLPSLGDSVGQGQALARITPGFDPGSQVALLAEQGQVAEDLALARQRARALGASSTGAGEIGGSALSNAKAEIRVRIETARARLARLERLTGVVPQREIEAAEAELRALQAQQATLANEAQTQARALAARQASLSRASSPEEIARAPVAGVVSGVSVVQGQVVAPGQTLFTIVNPSRLLVEAQATGDSASFTSPNATARTSDGRTVTLVRQGAGLAVVNGAAPLRYRVELSDGLRAGEAVTVFASSTLPAKGIAVPRQALTRAANGQNIVFVKEGAERFVPVAVTFSELDANTVVVTAGLSAGARVVTSGANLLAQVR